MVVRTLGFLSVSYTPDLGDLEARNSEISTGTEKKKMPQLKPVLSSQSIMKVAA